MPSTLYFTTPTAYWNRRDYGWMCLAALIPVGLMLIWNLNNNKIPPADATDFLWWGSTIYHHFANGNWWEGIKGLYSIRPWRPVAFHLPYVVFLSISDGNLIFSAGAMMVSCVLLSSIYIYALLRLKLDPPMALIGTILLASSPMAQWQGGTFGFAESGFFPAALATLYHTIRSDFFRNRRHSIYTIIALVLAFLFRPVEGVTHLTLPFLFYFAVGWRRGIFSGREISAVGAFALLMLSALILIGAMHGGVVLKSNIYDLPERSKFYTKLVFAALGILGLMAMAAIAYGALRFKRDYWSCKQSCILMVFGIALFIIAIWYGRAVPRFIDWFYTSNIGELAELGRQTVEQKQGLERLKGFIVFAGPFVFYGLMGLAAISFSFCLSKTTRASFKSINIAMLLAAVPLVYILTIVTVQYTPRKVAVIFPIIMIIATMISLSPGRLQKLRTAIILVLIIGLLIPALHINLGYGPMRGFANRYITIPSTWLVPEMSRPNPLEQTLEFMHEKAKIKGNIYISLAIVRQHLELLDPFSIALLIHATGDTALTSGYLPYATYDESSVNSYLEQSPQAFIIVNPVPGPIEQSNDLAKTYAKLWDNTDVPNDKIFFEILRLYATGQLKKKYGFEKRECFPLGPQAYEACYFERKK